MSFHGFATNCKVLNRLIQNCVQLKAFPRAADCAAPLTGDTNQQPEL